MDPNIDSLLWNGRARDSHGTEKIYGVVPAIVVKIDDTKEKRHQMGAVQIRFPWLTDEGSDKDLLPWARCVTWASGHNGDDAPCGWVSTPQMHDEVLVGFEDGDVHRPYVLGQLWNPKDGSGGSGGGAGGAAGGGGGGGGGAGQQGGGGNFTGQQGGGAETQQGGGQQQGGAAAEQAGAAAAAEEGAAAEGAGATSQVGGQANPEQAAEEAPPPAEVRPDPEEAPPAPPDPGQQGGPLPPPPEPEQPAAPADPGPPPADPILRRIQAKFPQGIHIVLYANYTTQNGDNAEIKRQADKLARDVESVSLRGADQLDMGKSIPCDSGQQAWEKVAAIGRLLKEKLEREQPGASPPFIKVKNLSICVHGMPYGVGLDKGNSFSKGLHYGISGKPSNIPDFVAAIRDFMVPEIQVQLFACNAARDLPRLRECWQRSGTNGMRESDAGYSASTYQEWIEHDENRPQARESFAAKLQEGLGAQSSVFGHGTAGHLYRNFSAKVVGAKAGGEGRHLFCLLYPTSFVDSEAGRLFPAAAGEERAALRWEMREGMWKHYKESYKDNQGYSMSLGLLAFIDLDKAKQEVQAKWAEYVQNRFRNGESFRPLTQWKKLSKARREQIVAGG